MTPLDEKENEVVIKAHHLSSGMGLVELLDRLNRESILLFAYVAASLPQYGVWHSPLEFTLINAHDIEVTRESPAYDTAGSDLSGQLVIPRRACKRNERELY